MYIVSTQITGSQHRGPRSIPATLSRLDALAADSINLRADHSATFTTASGTYKLPRYFFLGPSTGADPIRIGIFAGIHGDEPEGVHALIRLTEMLEKKPELARGYCLFLYPICNPTGFEDRTRRSRSGKDLNREFWRDSTEPEVRLLESELIGHAFDGIISLHTDDTSHGFYGFAQGATLTRDLLEPALQAAEDFLPRNRNEVIDGFRARDGIIRRGYLGMLMAPPKARPQPFDIVLETPLAAPTYLKEAALVASLQSILQTYRGFIAYAQNL